MPIKKSKMLYDVIERMYDRPTMVTIHEQLVKFNESIGMFGISAAVLIRKKMQPGPRNLNKVPNVKNKGKRQIVDLDDDEEEEDEEGDDIDLREIRVFEDEDENDDHFNLEV
ncbi:hypothetical protein L1887_10918 [Cichorium endivia]|nr:hypothetical protein L1887_10918 [Cichorium endivia]